MKVTGYDAWESKTKEYETLDVFPYTFILTCYVCDVMALAVKGVRPDGWKTLKGYGHTLCPGCATKLREMIER